VVWQLIVSGLVRWGLITIRVIAAWQVLFVSYLVLSGFQESCKNDCKREWLREKDTVRNWRLGCSIKSAFS
jgi:hypothetical protein